MHRVNNELVTCWVGSNWWTARSFLAKCNGFAHIFGWAFPAQQGSNARLMHGGFARKISPSEEALATYILKRPETQQVDPSKILMRMIADVCVSKPFFSLVSTSTSSVQHQFQQLQVQQVHGSFRANGSSSWAPVWAWQVWSAAVRPKPRRCCSAMGIPRHRWRWEQKKATNCWKDGFIWILIYVLLSHVINSLDTCSYTFCCRSVVFFQQNLGSDM